MRCDHCPVGPGLRCPGEDAPDPLCRYARERPGYDAVLRGHAGQMARHAPTACPPLLTQAGNALGAVARVIGAAVRREAVTVDQAEQDRRLAICRQCEHLDATGCVPRCTLCGCVARWKVRLASERCPLDPPKW